MILVAPTPNTEMVLGEGRSIYSDHRCVVYNADPADLDTLTQLHRCSPVKPYIVVNHFPDPASLHCFACGAFIEKPPHKDTWEWLKDGCIFDFLHEHYDHAQGSSVQDWPQYPAKGLAVLERQMDGPPESGSLTPMLFVAGVGHAGEVNALERPQEISGNVLQVRK